MGRPLGSKNKAHEIIEPNLDRSKPYAEVCGMPGAFYEQNGKFYSETGHFVSPRDCVDVNDEPDPPQDETYTEYNAVTYQESSPAIKKEPAKTSLQIIYGGEDGMVA